MRGAAVLDGARGKPPVDVDAVARLAGRVGDLLLEGDYSLIELNPVVVTPTGATALDALACHLSPVNRQPVPEQR